MKKSVVFIVVTMFALGFSAFTRKDEAPSKSDLLTAKTWKMSVYQVEPAYDFLQNGIAVKDIYHAFTCYQDNTLSFKKNGKFQSQEGKNHCGSSQSEIGNWFFDPSDTILIRQAAGESFCVDIVEISESRLMYTYKTEKIDANGKKLTLTFTEEYTAQ
ncbi:hypothetical protein WJR50_33595 [Catalinimonas sp. 4WD22]|uniref:hypothetical protein n=1 Tax=Catalinimonas locisalis TaxID=3133978 RepID=UPI003100B8F0